MRERSSSGQQRQARLIAREKELGDLKPTTKDSSLTDIMGLEARMILTRSTSISSKVTERLSRSGADSFLNRSSANAQFPREVPKQARGGAPQPTQNGVLEQLVIVRHGDASFWLGHYQRFFFELLPPS